MSVNPVVSLDAVSVNFGARAVLKDFSIEVMAGESVALMGPSGSGKTTVLSLITGHRLPSSGTVTLGVSPSQIAWVIQNAPILPRRSVVDNALLQARVASGRITVHQEDDLDSTLDSLGLSALRQQAGYTLSGGEKQRVVVARALLSNPRLIVADEPTAALDSYSRDLVVGGLLEIVSMGSALVVATHDQHVADLCDRVIQVVPL